MTAPQTPKSRRTVFYVSVVLGVVILVPSMLGFGLKFLELFHVVTGDGEGLFALTPIVNYLLASLGFASLLLWATFRGMFHDIESPKNAMLDIESQLDEYEDE
ncbi:MAG: hypothetical protein KDA84_06815 [Planctomycetaceae bacterium]|nr:hypothetical protein [Planctomycetaceae bacterium]